MLQDDLTIYSHDASFTSLTPDDIPEQLIIRRLWDTGYFCHPANKNGHNVQESDLPSLDLKHKAVKKAIALYQGFDANAEILSLSPEFHGRSIIPDGEIGPATRTLLTLDRCAIPDFFPEGQETEAAAIGNGSWANCHGFDGYHAAVVGMDMENRPQHLQGDVLTEVLKWTQSSYDEVGLRWIFRDNATGRDVITGDRVDSRLNTRFEWVRRSNGWIGLATLPSGALPCQHGEIFNNYLATYTGGYTQEDIINQWGSLVKHELGHNTGRDHTSGGVMNPSIINGLPRSWRGDPSYNWLRSRFGGEPIPTEPVQRQWVKACLHDNLGGQFCIPLNPPINIGDPLPGLFD